MREQQRIDRAEIRRKGGRTMRKKALKTLVLVVLFTFCTASITWAGGPYTTSARSSRSWGGGYYYGPTETWGYGGHFKHEEGGTGAQIEKGASGVGKGIAWVVGSIVVLKEGPSLLRAIFGGGREAPQEQLKLYEESLKLEEKKLELAKKQYEMMLELEKMKRKFEKEYGGEAPKYDVFIKKSLYHEPEHQSPTKITPRKVEYRQTISPAICNDAIVPGEIEL